MFPVQSRREISLHTDRSTCLIDDDNDDDDGCFVVNTPFASMDDMPSTQVCSAFNIVVRMPCGVLSE